MPAYSSTPLVKKLGIKPGSTLALLGAPREFRGLLTNLPPGVRVVTRLVGTPDLSVWFVRANGDLTTKVAMVATAMGQGLWIAWPKKSSGVHTDVTEATVRRAGLAEGLVDYKVCAIDDIWSGLKFARRTGAAALQAGRTSGPT